MVKLLLTNNELVKKKFSARVNTDYEPVPYEKILEKARDLVHCGWVLLTHPLSGSIKPNETMYKSILLQKGDSPLHMDSLHWIERAMETNAKFPAGMPSLPVSRTTINSQNDYALLDLTLIESALQTSGL